VERRDEAKSSQHARLEHRRQSWKPTGIGCRAELLSAAEGSLSNMVSSVWIYHREQFVFFSMS